MRFLYGFLIGLTATSVAAILYLAFAGGDYLLQLSPNYQEMRTRLGELERLDRDRQELVVRLDAMEKQFSALSERFARLAERAPREAPPPPGASAPAEEPPSTP